MPKIGFKWATLALYMLISGFGGIILFIYVFFFVEDFDLNDNPLLFSAMWPGLLAGYIFGSYGWVVLLPMFLVQFIYFSFLGFPLYLIHICLVHILLKYLNG